MLSESNDDRTTKEVQLAFIIAKKVTQNTTLYQVPGSVYLHIKLLYFSVYISPEFICKFDRNFNNVKWPQYNPMHVYLAYLAESAKCIMHE